MSRTYRRTDRPTPSWVFKQWGWWLPYGDAPIDPNSKEGRKAKALFHADSTSYRTSAPNSFVRFYNKASRQQARAELHKFIALDGEYDVIINANHRRSATYDWW